MNDDARFALSRELTAHQILIDQLRQIADDDPDFLGDLLEGQTNVVELIGKLDSSIVDDEVLVEGAKAAAERLTNRRRAAENRIDLKRRLLVHALDQIGLKTLRTPTSTLTVTEAAIKAVPITPEDIPSQYWKPQPPKLDQDALTKAIRAREKAIKEAEAIADQDARKAAFVDIANLHPEVPGVVASNGGLTLMRRV
jgi:hypothetical protein